MLTLEAIVTLLTRFIPDAEQREKAAQAIRDNYVRFIMATRSPLYDGLRALIILGALWDAFFNGGRAWAETSRNLVASGPAGAIEMLVIAWLFLGDEVVKPMAQAFTQMLAAIATKVGTSSANGGAGPGPVSRPHPTPDRPERE